MRLWNIIGVAVLAVVVINLMGMAVEEMEAVRDELRECRGEK